MAYNTDNKGKLFFTFFARRRVQKMRHTLSAYRQAGLHRDTFLAPLMRGTTTLTAAVVVRQLAEQPTFIAGPLGGWGAK
jgi:hypothetical protein